MKNQMIFYLVVISILFSKSFADGDIYNQIENDHRVRNFAFIGPFVSFLVIFKVELISSGVL